MLAASIAGVGALAKAVAPKFTFSEIMAGPIPRIEYVIDTKGELYGALSGRAPMANPIIFSPGEFDNVSGALEKPYETLDEIRRLTAIMESH
jgi:hypothetical protein